MDNTIALKPVKELLGMNFFIPDYQRGYRWTAQQATDLLEDIWTFTQKEKEHSEIYCLQPLVVQRKTEDIREAIRKTVNENSSNFIEDVEKLLKGSWNIVDGQQRLTTIYIILSTFGSLPYETYEIDYQTRAKSKEFLKNISKKEENEAKENIDFYHMYLVYDAVKNWLSKLDNSMQQKFQETLLEKVNFIWYKIPDESTPDSRREAIATFTRLNIGKIPLTDSELVKALFLNRSNFDCSSMDLEIQQRKIAMEWDQIEYALQDDAFWLFLHDKGYDKPTRIDFILDMICAQDIFELKQNPKREREIDTELGNDEHRTFRYFYYAFSNSVVTKEWLQDKWNCIHKYFQIFNEWFHDYKLYHYIGYLTIVPKDDLTIVSKDGDLIQNLVKNWDKYSKEKFTETVKDKIYTILSKNDGFRDLDNFVYEEEFNGSTVSKRKCIPILLLHNIETIVQQNDKLVSEKRYALPNFTKFPFHLYKVENWEVEHIRPNSGDKIQSEGARKVYAHLAKMYLPDTNNLHARIDNFLDGNKDEKESFEVILEEILEADNSLDDSEKNKIWNYALLDGQTNKEYGNLIFPIKRAFLANKERGYKIIFKISNGKIDTSNKKDEIAFVPPCTRNIFAKFYTDIPNGMLEWTQKDAKAYLADIKEKLGYYLNKLQETHNSGGEN